MMDLLPDDVLLHVFKFLSPTDIARAGQCCRRFRRIAHDDILWRDLFHSYFNIQPVFNKPIGKENWRSEFIRLVDETPFVEAEVITKHTDQVLHVSFSHDGKRFATCGKDAFIYVWQGTHPVELEFHRQMKKFNWKYTQFSEFNESDTLLLVSGVLFGLHSTSGEIAVFNLEEGFRLQCRIQSKPYDIFGTWYSEHFLFSGDLRWLGHLVSKSTIWLNKASQEVDSEHTNVINKMFSFYNPRASSIRSIMIAKCVEPRSEESARIAVTLPNGHIHPKFYQPSSSAKVQIKSADTKLSTEKLREINSKGTRGTLQGAFQNWRPLENVADIDYTLEYHSNNLREKVAQQPSSSASSSISRPNSGRATRKQSSEFDRTDSSEEKRAKIIVPNSLDPTSEDEADDMESSMFDDFQVPNKCESVYPPGSSGGSMSSNESTSGSTSTSANEVIDEHDKWLIFTCGSETYTPHQVGFKKIKPFSFKSRMEPGPSIRERREELRRRQQLEQSGQQEVIDYMDYSRVAFMFDEIDHVVDLHGHIIGMALSPDHRYLYVNSRPWPTGYKISDPLDPPPIAQEIDIHVIDLATLTQVGMMRRAHRAYTPNEECFFIFLDACDMYLASGSEDKHGYLWDRHYGVSLAKLPHADVCNSVAFNPIDSRMLISVSDDGTIKVWRSRDQCRELNIDLGTTKMGTELYLKRRASCPTAVPHT